MIRKTNLQSIFSILSMTAFLFVFTTFSLGQSGSATVSGTVRDANGAAVPGATVTIISTTQGTKRNSVTNSDGVYNFALLQPGAFRIEVEAKTFKKSVTESFQASVEKVTTLDVQLQTGGIAEVVTVESGGVDGIRNTETAELGNNFNSQQIQNLPLSARNVGDLLSLQSAVTPDGSVAGGRSDQANITLDGVDVNEQQNGPAFTPVLRVTPDSVEEFRVTTTNADASRGRSSGAQISLVTKSGGNSFRGALFEYHRPTETSANDFFNNKAGVARPKRIRNNFGGRLGGPIVKDKLFFFYSYEGFREAKGEPITRIVPLASLGRGELRFFNSAGVLTTLNTTQINALTTAAGVAVVDVNPAAAALFASAASRYPANDTTVGDGLNTSGFRFNVSQPVQLNTNTARFDWKITENGNHAIAVRGNYQQDLESNGRAFPDTPTTARWSHPLGINIGHTWIVKSNLVNRFNYGLTRNAFSDQGDSTNNTITFRGVFSPVNFARTFSRVTPVQNFVDDVSWIKGNHTIQFGVNFRIVRNRRSDLAQSFDSAVTNQSFYQGSGSVVSAPVIASGNTIRGDFIQPVRTALTALFGRFSQYAANYNFGLDGSQITSGTPIIREFATEEYDGYIQDSWKARSNLTITLGLRYGLSRPVYETQGFQAKPDVSLQEYFDKRVAAAQNGQNYTDPIKIVLAGPKNKAPGFYELDKNNFQPRVSVAWSPNFQSGWLSKLFGKEQDTVLRGGFSITNDYFGQALAVNFDGNNQLGFSSQRNISANTYNVTTNPAPLYTGPGQSIRTLPGIIAPGALSFPQQQPQDDQRRIQGSLDSNLKSPINYSWNVSLGRKLPSGLYVEASYIGRVAKNLLAARDILNPNDLKDPASGQTWYEATTILENLRRNGTPISQIPNLPFFQNIYTPGSLSPLLIGGTLTNTQAAYGFMQQNGTDWTYLQDVLDQVTRPLFYQRQYGALSAYGTIGSSNYQGAAFTVRQRLKGLTWDLNYTFSKSFDDASGLQTSGVYGSAFILNALRQRDSRANSDFDFRHLLNVNGVWELPVGKGKTFFADMNPVLNAVFGGWQLSSIFRFNTGAPTDDFFDIAGWPSNWNVRSRAVRNTPIQSSPTKEGTPNLFSNRLAAYRSFRSPGPGESGDRNQFRAPGYIVMDAGIQKSFNMPWREGHKISIRADAFNITNTQRFSGINLADTTIGLDPQLGGTPGPNWGNFTQIQGTPRVMQFAFRYEF
jgi:hypothetical protein